MCRSHRVQNIRFYGKPLISCTEGNESQQDDSDDLENQGTPSNLYKSDRRYGPSGFQLLPSVRWACQGNVDDLLSLADEDGRVSMFFQVGKTCYERLMLYHHLFHFTHHAMLFLKRAVKNEVKVTKV